MRWGQAHACRGQAQVLQYRSHSPPCLHVRQDPPPASTPHSGQHVEVERPLQQLCPIHSRPPLLHPLLADRCLGRLARLLCTCLREPTPSRASSAASACPSSRGRPTAMAWPAAPAYGPCWGAEPARPSARRVHGTGGRRMPLHPLYSQPEKTPVKPYAGNPHVRLERRRVETGRA